MLLLQLMPVLLLQNSAVLAFFVAPFAPQETWTHLSARRFCLEHDDSAHEEGADCELSKALVSSPTGSSPVLRRRKALQTGAAALASIWSTPSCANAQLFANKNNELLAAGTGIDCLQDLPSFDPKTTVRLFLARHGETENNRLNKLQGARIDAPINGTGERQATLLGQALARADISPQFILHSPLLRAQQTARIAAAQLTGYDSTVTRTTRTQSLDVLTELDFGQAAEGEPVEARRAQRLQTYAQWASGNLSVRMNSGGETGREMLLRIERALQTLVSTASQTETGCIAAVAHSAYLRMLLATVSDISLLSAYQLKQANCCVNVLDFNRQVTSSSSGIVSTVNHTRDLMHRHGTASLLSAVPLGQARVSQLPLDLGIPDGRVERINETRHLQALSAA